MSDYMRKAMEWSHRDIRDEAGEEFGYVSGESEPDKAEKIAFELYRDLRDRRGVLEGIEDSILNKMIHTHIGIIKNILNKGDTNE